MKRTVFAGLLLSSALVASPAFAANDLCDSNLQTLKDAQVSSNTNLSPETLDMLKKAHQQGMDAKAAGNEKECIEVTTKAITDLKKIGSGNEGAK